jgi:formamidopyrimidine-DNA glycosylase
VDQRIFGSMAIDRLLPSPDGHAAGFGSDAALIPDSGAHRARSARSRVQRPRFFDALAKRCTGIKRALLDQNLISGIGKYPADGTFRRPVHHTGHHRPQHEPARFWLEVRLVLGDAAEGGTSFDANGTAPPATLELRLSAYGQVGGNCLRWSADHPRRSSGERGSHFCPFAADPAS